MLKQSLKSILPRRVVAKISAYRWWVHLEKSYDYELHRRVVAKCDLDVTYGPFSGLRLTPKHLSTHVLLGTYEIELHPWFRRLFKNKYGRCIDIGSGEGYYAVSMAMQTGAPVDAYDPAPQVRQRCLELARLNSVADHVTAHSWCDRKTLLKLAGRRCLILSDCEGYEIDLFAPQVIDALRNSDLIIELHGDARAMLEPRFRETHSLEFVGMTPRDPRQFPQLASLDPEDARRAIDEGARGTRQEWMLATAK